LSLEVNGLSFSYGTRKVLDNVSFRVEAGELLAVLGPNGVGKSTLFRCMLGLLRDYTGECKIDGESINNMNARQLARRVAYIPQTHYPSFNFSVFDMVLMGTTARISAASSPGPRQKELAAAALERLGISHLSSRGYTQISGGEQQLTLIARALVQETRVLIMDEPTSSLDYGNQLRVMSEVRSLAHEGYTVIESTHNPDQAFLYSDRILALSEGIVAACGPPKEVLDEALVSRLYGVDVKIFSLDSDKHRVCVPASPEVSSRYSDGAH